MTELKQTERARRILNEAFECSVGYRHEFVTPEHLLLVLLSDNVFYLVLSDFINPLELSEKVEKQLEEMDTMPDDVEYVPDISEQMSELIGRAFEMVLSSNAEAMDMPHLVRSMLFLEESWASYLLNEALGDNEPMFMSKLISVPDFESGSPDESKEGADRPAWKNMITCMNELYEQHNPLIGREQELQRTIQVLCRRDKNNPLHVGEPGVGKTALVWGLARLIEEQKVPERLKNSRIYQLDVGSLLAGTQYRGDFENRIKQIMDGIREESTSNIVYIDEIHTLVGAGATGEGSMDASNMLKPYLESGEIRFIGSTTYEEYNRHFSKSKGLVRRFQQIDILEPSIEEAKHILRQLQPRYEEFHGVTYEDEAIDYAVEASAKYINERFLPDKAIDMIDEAGAAMEIQGSTLPIGKKEIADVLSKACKVETLTECEEDDLQRLEVLAPHMLAQIYGQDEAVRQVVQAVQMSRAGLSDENKPQASLLFVGPTGVGKTEVARVLAKELGLELLRFDMSEYTEKHTVAKLIGSPAGYVGYEDGGLLTDAIRKAPHCVLLLDEIEKAHPDIYNILLQVMDYARLTDNKGRHADFRNVVLIMTSNAGAQYASQATVGFGSTVTRGEAMLAQVKKSFKPEFLNRLSGTVVFRDMDKEMATLILRKKLGELEAKLRVKNVTMNLNPEAFDHLLNQGFIPEYGAREMDRAIARLLKPLLMKEILFGSLKHGGTIDVIFENGSISVR